MLQISASGDKEALATAKIAVLKAKEEAINAARRAAKALAKAESAARGVERLGLKPAGNESAASSREGKKE